MRELAIQQLARTHEFTTPKVRRIWEETKSLRTTDKLLGEMSFAGDRVAESQLPSLSRPGSANPSRRTSGAHRRTSSSAGAGLGSFKARRKSGLSSVLNALSAEDSLEEDGSGGANMSGALSGLSTALLLLLAANKLS